MTKLFKRLSQTVVLEVPNVEVVAWSNGEPEDAVPLSQVHLLIDLKDLDVTFAVRFKSAEGLNNFIKDLELTRDMVWPKEVKN